MKVIEILPQFERVKGLTWLRRQKSSCLKWEFKSHLKNLRRQANVFALEYKPPAPTRDRDAIETITTFSLHPRETELDCAPYSQRPEEWKNHKHPGEAVQIALLTKRARYLSVSECPPEWTILEFETAQAANAAKQMIDDTACGNQCRGASHHYIIRGRVKW